MRAQEFDSASVEELQEMANDCFDRAELPDDALNNFIVPADERMRLLMKAQFYLTAVARKRDEATAKRDFKLEVAVIVLIGIEILLSIGFGLWGIHEGNKQADILDKLRGSTDATASAMLGSSGSLKALDDGQAQSLDRLKEMNDKLKGSLTATGTMASATRKQLKILEQEQADRTAQLAKKPRLLLSIGSIPLMPGPFNALHYPSFPIREQTDTSMTVDSGIVNQGNASATRVQLRVIVDATDVSLSANANLIQTNEPPDNPFRTSLINLDLIRPNVNVPITLTFFFPKGRAAFQVIFNVDADQIETATPLGVLTVSPRKPVN